MPWSRGPWKRSSPSSFRGSFADKEVVERPHPHTASPADVRRNVPPMLCATLLARTTIASASTPPPTDQRRDPVRSTAGHREQAAQPHRNRVARRVRRERQSIRSPSRAARTVPEFSLRHFRPARFQHEFQLNSSHCLNFLHGFHIRCAKFTWSIRAIAFRFFPPIHIQPPAHSI